jgi:hypothetical protein
MQLAERGFPLRRRTAPWGRHGLVSSTLATFDPHVCFSFRALARADGPSRCKLAEPWVASLLKEWI